MLKTVRTPTSRRAGPACRMAGWRRWANRNPIPTSRMQVSTMSGGASTATPSASRTSADPQRLLTARLPCLATGMPAPAVTSAAAVDMLNVSAASPPVPQVSTTGSPPASMNTACRRIAAAAPAISSAVSPFIRRATANPAIWAAVASPAMMMSMARDDSSRERSRLSMIFRMDSFIVCVPYLFHGLRRPSGNFASGVSRRESGSIPGGIGRRRSGGSRGAGP